MALTDLGKGLSHLIDMDLLDENSIIVDAGCSYGDFVRKMREFDNTKLSVIHAIECRKTNVSILQNLNFENVFLYEAALVGQDSEDLVEFEDIISPDDKYHEWGNVKNLNRIERLQKVNPLITSERYQVPTIKINDIFHKMNIDKIDYLKMDIEGSEEDVIATMSEETSSKIKQMSMEIHDNVVFDDVVSHLKRLGYVIGGDKNEVYAVHV